jgi:ABC-2 type transport system permease protein
MRNEQGLNWRAIKAIMHKDLRVALQSKSVTLPMIIMPLLLVVLMPTLTTIGISFAGSLASDPAELAELVAIMPAEVRQQFGNYDLTQMAVLFVLRYMYAPLYLIMPIMVSSVIAADSFAGEKERKTLEALLYTPTTDRDLLLAKLLGAWLPGIAVAWGSALIFWVVGNIAAWSLFHELILPNVMWLLLALWVAPAAAGMGLGASVIVSARVNTFQDAYQLSGLVVLPVVLLMLGQVTGLLFLSEWVVLAVGAIFWLIDAVLVIIGARTFRRSELLARL